MRRSVAAAAAVAIVMLFLSVPSPAQESRQPAQAEIEAAYLINFLRCTQWPEHSFENAQAPYVITVVGSQSVAESMRGVAQAASSIDGRAIEVRWLPDVRGSRAVPLASEQDRDVLAQLRRSHLVFFDSSAGVVSGQTLAGLFDAPILTVSDAPGFVSSGGMLGLIKLSDHIVFEANPGAIRHANLLLSAKVLKLARLARNDAP